MSNNDIDLEASGRRLNYLKIALVGVVGYVVGSFLPAGYVNYMIRSRIFPETVEYRRPAFDRTKLRAAQPTTIAALLDTLKENPALFAQRYEGKPVIVGGTIEHFINGAAGDERLTFTLETAREFESVFLSFDNPRDPSVVALRRGGPVRAACMVSITTTSSVHLDHCEVTRPQ